MASFFDELAYHYRLNYPEFERIPFFGTLELEDLDLEDSEDLILNSLTPRSPTLRLPTPHTATPQSDSPRSSATQQSTAAPPSSLPPGIKPFKFPEFDSLMGRIGRQVTVAQYRQEANRKSRLPEDSPLFEMEIKAIAKWEKKTGLTFVPGTGMSE